MLNGDSPCASNSDCSLNGLCNSTSGLCACDSPWTGPRCGVLSFAASSPSAGKSLYPANDTLHNTWNGPMLGPVQGTYHMYLPLYPAGLLYHPTALLHGSAPTRFGPWTWQDLPGVEVSINPGAMVYEVGNEPRYTIWVSKPDGQTIGAIFHSASPDGPFLEVPGSNSSGCYINPSPLFTAGHFYCIGGKGTLIRAAPHLEGIAGSCYAIIVTTPMPTPALELEYELKETCISCGDMWTSFSPVCLRFYVADHLQVFCCHPLVVCIPACYHDFAG